MPGGPREEGGAPYTCACDAWSAGVTAFAMVTGEMAYEIPEDGGGPAILAAVRAGPTTTIPTTPFAHRHATARLSS